MLVANPLDAIFLERDLQKFNCLAGWINAKTTMYVLCMSFKGRSNSTASQCLYWWVTGQASRCPNELHQGLETSKEMITRTGSRCARGTNNHQTTADVR
ncbi:hypothetical protein PAXRUDRAFT_765727 [Paxillus rubicundulus Ve08.2h10]|uniref:Uncharacterized protein n=1 Tax=Paxillus rubicundulus Ve08.2h10 TaxID=930991 RepID=A0A0D0D9L4_9AGAM|nr:hypothetical protein PAXRUDRAFT_765727 [Paxillus rubicundulus Ve08.2h10]